VNVLEKLASFPLFEPVPVQELEWLVTRGAVKEVTSGAILMDAGVKVDEMLIVLSGTIVVYVRKEGGWRKFYDMEPGFVLGAMPYSRLHAAPARAVAEGDSSVFALNRSHFGELVRECPELTSALVHQLLDRSRAYRTAQLHDERMQSLGRLAAGLAHELNNPASGATSFARSLAQLLEDVHAASRELMAARLTDEKLESIDAIRSLSMQPAPVRNALEMADREEELSEWMDRHGIDSAAASQLSASSVTLSALDKLAAALSAHTIGAAIRWAASDIALRESASQIMTATGRIHDLVSAVKGFSFLDREGVPDDVDIASGLANTVSMLENKSRAKSLRVEVESANDLPRVHGLGSELNQVWEKLIDNAIDAAPVEGTVTVTASHRGDHVVVRVTDNGVGIPQENRARIFDPFFTTKPVGSGAGLGLDIARRFVELNDGDLEFTSQPSHTVFRVRFPVSRR
jgi:signal transduction histidine kinase